MTLRAQISRLLGQADAPSRVIPLDAATFGVAIGRPDRDVIVDFWAPWCDACRRLAGSIERLADEHPEVSVASLDVDRAPRVADRYRVEQLPTVIRFHRGEPAATVTGLAPYDVLLDRLGL